MFDKEELKKAMKAFKKRLKVLRLDDESRLSHGAMTKGEGSAIAGIQPPDQFPKEIWDELVSLGKLKVEGYGTYSIVR